MRKFLLNDLLPQVSFPKFYFDVNCYTGLIDSQETLKKALEIISKHHNETPTWVLRKARSSKITINPQDCFGFTTLFNGISLYLFLKAQGVDVEKLNI